MRVLFCTTGGLGHLLPLRPLARALRKRGHQIAWVTAPDALPKLQGEGFDLFPAGRTFEASRRAFSASHADAAHLSGETLSAYTFPRLFGAVLGPEMIDGVLAAARRWRPDFVVHEPGALAVPLVCQQLGVRYVTHGYGLRPPREYIERAMKFFSPFWRTHGLEAPADGGLYRHLYLDIAPTHLQPTSESMDSNVFRFNAYRHAVKVPRSLPTDLQAALQGAASLRPRIYVTFGTVFNRSPTLVAAARAAARIGGTVVVTTGSDSDLARFADLGAAVHVHRFVEQDALLPYCDGVISHGGAGTLLGAAAHAVPHLVLPQAADHFRNARALSAVNAGRVMNLECQTVEAATSALSDMLEEQAVRTGARTLAQNMADMPTVDAAAAELERWQLHERTGSA